MPLSLLLWERGWNRGGGIASQSRADVPARPRAGRYFSESYIAETYGVRTNCRPNFQWPVDPTGGLRYYLPCREQTSSTTTRPTWSPTSGRVGRNRRKNGELATVRRRRSFPAKSRPTIFSLTIRSIVEVQQRGGERSLRRECQASKREVRSKP